MNFGTLWEENCFKNCASACKCRIKHFLCCVPLKAGAWLISIHTCINGIILVSVLFDESEEPTSSVSYQITVPNDARLLYGLTGSPFIVLSIELLIGVIRKKMALLINFVVGMQILLVFFPILFSAAFARTYICTSDYFKRGEVLGKNLDDLMEKKQIIFYLLYGVLAYYVICYVLYIYYIIVVLSLKENLKETKNRDVRVKHFKLRFGEEKVVEITSSKEPHLEPPKNDQQFG